MIVYLDTSVVVSVLVNEATTTETVRWLRESGGQLALSEWTATEFAGALAMKVRTSAMQPCDRERTQRIFDQRFRPRTLTFPVTTDDFRTAAQFVGKYEYGLRAPDALHMAIASANFAVLFTRDRPMAEAGMAMGLSVEYRN